MAEEDLELEVKVLDMDFSLIREKIESRGARRISEEEQTNLLLESPFEGQIEEGSYLRIRNVKKDGEASSFLTYKKLLSSYPVRKNLEITTEILDPENTLKIFEEMGFSVKIGKKNRLSYMWEGARFDFDRWDKETYPFPYLEIEVRDKDHLRKIIEELSIPEDHISRKSIKELQEDLEKD